MHLDMQHEQVIYQNPFLAMRIWQIDSTDPAPEELRLRTEQDWKHKRYNEWHYHEEIEFLLILKGELTIFCTEEQLVLRKGDIALFGSSEPHRTIQTDESLRYLVFQLNLRKYWDASTLNSMRHFSEVIRPLSALNYIYRDSREARTQTAIYIREIFREINTQQLGYELAVSSLIKSILLLLMRHDNKQQLHYNDNIMLERFQMAIDYVEEHLSEKLSVTKLSSLTNLSYTHFIKTFKKAVGMSFTEFVVYKRIKKAEQQLLTSELSIAEVAESVGISNLGHFYDLFRRHNHCSPKQFKDKLR